MRIKIDDVHLIQDIERQFDQSFGHLDFWRLSKKWKKKVYYDVAKRMLWLIRENDKYEEEQKHVTKPNTP